MIKLDTNRVSRPLLQRLSSTQTTGFFLTALFDIVTAVHLQVGTAIVYETLSSIKIELIIIMTGSRVYSYLSCPSFRGFQVTGIMHSLQCMTQSRKHWQSHCDQH
jgi:hypothetical protein